MCRPMSMNIDETYNIDKKSVKLDFLPHVLQDLVFVKKTFPPGL